jgi:tetratricopeptide (TPR) repeat protein
MAAELEEEGQLESAAEMYRAAMAAGGPTAERCFQLAELLYRLEDRAGARERYFMAIELDEGYVEARVNLGCLLAEIGQAELAAAALQGALASHPDYADAHYHLARVLDSLGRTTEAAQHWRAVWDLAPESPWGEQARERLGGQPAD